jgi:SAM-dependent methyltransferase
MKKIDLEVLKCPNCNNGQMLFVEDYVYCPECKNKYNHSNNKYIFQEFSQADVSDFLDRIKFRIKKYSYIYDILIKLVSPVCPTINLKKTIRIYIAENELLGINLGSGNIKISEDVINLDIFPYSNVDIVCDIEKLPLRNETVGVVFNIAVLEHVKNPEAVVREIHRVLSPGGIVVSFVPFIQAFHASPYDYSRRTYEGMKVLYKDFDIIELKAAGGPTSGFLWIFQEWVSIILSFGIKPVYYLLNLLLMLITFPIKFLDFLLIHHPMAKSISSGFLFIGRKK